ncbi:MAG TPA: exosortase F system-associated protein [Chryseosolibacter sp.]|nr:exosortase F system-associated protein [Chryseosolibacter sp.]
MQRPDLRWLVGLVCFAGLIAVFIFQRTDIAALLGTDDRSSRFFINRLIRFLLNDAFMIGVIYALFYEKKYVIFALWVQLAGIIIILVPYFVIKSRWPGYNGPLVSFLHRLILNPTLLLLLIPAFYYQKISARNGGK